MSDQGKRRRVSEDNPYLAHHHAPQDEPPTVNPLNGVPYSNRFHQIYQTRKQLPIYHARGDVLHTLAKNRVIVLEGETGSGKTTQVPQLLVEEGLAGDKMICCTQPRRVAATSVARRVAEEMDVQIGQEVGYSVRFDECTSNNTILKYLTDGMLLREAMADKLFEAYSIIVLDEAHERTLATDILMGMLKTVMEKRQDLKVVVMSATLDAHKFQEYFNGAPLIKVPGRMFPVEMVYSSAPEDDYVEACIRTATEIHTTEKPGDILIFLTGEEEIEDCVRKIENNLRGLQDQYGLVEVLPLYGSLPPNRQQAVFKKPMPPRRAGQPPTRKIICATNIAETSLTIDGVVYVIDPGFAKTKIYNPRVRVESLLVQAISRASAKQRAGRAGRTRPGKCFRLYTEESFRTELIATAHPEILRSNLGNVVLMLLRLGVNDLVHFDFMDPPAPETLMRALELLNYLGALDDEGEMTKFGRDLAEFPLDPQHAACLIHSAEYGCSSEVLSIVAMLSSAQNWFVRRRNDRRCDDARDMFTHHEADFLTLLNVFNRFDHMEREDPQGVMGWCKGNYVNPRALKTASHVRKQLVRIMKRLDLEIKEAPEDKMVELVKKALLEAFFQQVAFKTGRGQYQTCKDQQSVSLHPSCGLKTQPEWICYHEYVLTKKQYIRTCMSVKGHWLIDMAPHYFDLENFPEGPCKIELRKLYRTKQYRANGAKSKNRRHD